MLSQANKMTKKVFVVCFSLLMVAMSISPAFAADVQLTENNIVEYPTIEGEIYFTQKVGDCLTLTGGKVTTDCTAEGEEIPGHFEWLDPNFTPTSTTAAQRGSIKFIPENEDLYSTIEVTQSKDMRFKAKKAPLALADPDTTVTADIEKAGDALRNAKINEVPVICTLSGETVEDVKWQWSTTAIVNESGFYPAMVSKTNYETLTVDVYVKVPGEVEITQYPTIKDPPVQWHEGLKVGDLELEGGKATIPGDFSFSDPDAELKAGYNNIDIIFIPQDELSQPILKRITLYLEKAEVAFIDENGEAYVPELPLTQGTCTLGTIRSMLEAKKANCGTFKIGDINIEGIELRHQLNNCDFTLENKEEGYAATAQLQSQENNNYTNTVQFKIVIVKNKINPNIQSQGNNTFAVVDRNIFSSATLAGLFTVEVKSEKGEYAQTITDIKLNVPFEYHPGKSGKYTFTITYDDTNDEKYELPNPVEVSKDIVLSWTVTGKNIHFESRQATYGEEVMVDATITNDKFGGWKFYDESGKEIKDFNYTETSQNLRITFTMPDHPITVEAVDKTQSNGGNNFSDCFANFVKWLNNLAARLKALFDAIAQLLTVVG